MLCGVMTEKYCPVCEKKGAKNLLKLCCVNFGEGILLCEDEMCVYPFGAAAVVESFLFKIPSAGIPLQKQAERKNEAKTASPVLTPQFYWSNTDNLCWLDSVMTVLVNNRCLQLCLQKYQPKDSILQLLCSNFNKAQSLGPIHGQKLLLDVRVKVFEFLKSKMQCSLGVNDSALASIIVLLKDNSMISEKFCQECEWVFKCSSCGYTQVDRHKRLVVTFPNTTDDFAMPCGVFQRACYKCMASGEKSQLDLKRLPPCVMAHFVEGVKNKDFLKSGFVCQGKDYELCQLIQYKKNPDHFVAWIRNSNGTHWAKVDDTRNGICKWTKGEPSFPLDQVHVAVWERANVYKRKSSSVEVANRTLERPHAWETKVVKATSAESSVNSNDEHSTSIHLSNSLTSTSINENNDRKNNLDMKSNGERCARQKRKNVFEPYIPKKKRNLSTDNSLCRDEEKTVVVNKNKCTNAASNFSHWKPVSVVDKVGVISDNQSDSGYSSPGSNSSCVSQPSCIKDENFILNEIIDSLNDVDIPDNKRNEKDSEKCDSLWSTSSSHGEAKQEKETPKTAKENALGSDALKSCDHISKATLYSCTGSSIGEIYSGNGQEKMSELDSLRKSQESPCDFADIEDVSNCGSDIMDKFDSRGFLENLDFLNDVTGQNFSMVSRNSISISRIEALGCDSVLCPAEPTEKNCSTTEALSSHKVCGSISLAEAAFQQINLPELTQFLQHEVDIEKNSFTCGDILEEIFPSKLLEEKGQASVSEHTDCEN